MTNPVAKEFLDYTQQAADASKVQKTATQASDS